MTTYKNKMHAKTNYKNYKNGLTKRSKFNIMEVNLVFTNLGSQTTYRANSHLLQHQQSTCYDDAEMPEASPDFFSSDISAVADFCSPTSPENPS